MIITEIAAYKGGKFSISLNGEPAFLLYSSEIESLRLKEGMDLSPDKRMSLLELLSKRAKKRTLHLLDRKDLTEAELRKKLAQDLYPDEAVDAAVSAAKTGRFLDDRRYAAQYVRDKSLRKSRRIIEIELKQKGIAEELIEEAMEEASEDNEREVLRKLLLKKCPDPASIDLKEKQKILRYFSGKGFQSSDIINLLDEISSPQ